MRLRKLAQPKHPKTRLVRRTAVTFTAAELDDVARILGAGRAILRQDFPIVARLKAAMTRVGVSTKGV